MPAATHCSLGMLLSRHHISFPCSYQILHPGRSSAYLLMTSHPAAQHGRHPTSHTSLLHNCLASLHIPGKTTRSSLWDSCALGRVVHGPSRSTRCLLHAPISLQGIILDVSLRTSAGKLARLMPLYGLYLGVPPHTFLLHSSYSLWLMPSLYVTNDAGL